MQMESSNYPPMHIGLGTFAVISCSLFHRLLSSTFVGLFRSQKYFLALSTELMKVSIRLVILVTEADMIRVLVARRAFEYTLQSKYCAFKYAL